MSLPEAIMLKYYFYGWVGQSSSCVRLFATSQTVARQAPLSVGFSRQEYWSGLPVSSPEDLPEPGIKPRSPPLQADSLPSELQGRSHLLLYCMYLMCFGKKKSHHLEKRSQCPDSRIIYEQGAYALAERPSCVVKSVLHTIPGTRGGSQQI